MALTLIRSISPASLPSLREDYYETLSLCYQSLGLFDKAKGALLAALKSLSHNDPFIQVRFYQRLGHIARQRERFHEGKDWFKKSEAMAKKVKERSSNLAGQLILDARCGEALCERGLGKFKQSERIFKSLLQYYRKQTDKDGEAFVYWALGTTQRFLGNLKEAEVNLRQSIQLYAQLRNLNGLAYSRCGLAGVLRMKGLAKDSGKLYRTAHRQFRKGRDNFGMAYSFCGQANAARMQNSYAAARQFFKKSITKYNFIKQKGPLGFVFWSLAQLELSLGNMSVAKRYLRRAEACFKEVHDKRGLVYSYLGWGDFFQRSQNKKALMFYRMAKGRAKQLDLKLEQVHAQARIKSQSQKHLYKKLGVNLSAFTHYSSLP